MLHEGQKDTSLVQYIANKNNHSSKVSRILHERQEVTSLVQCLVIKTITLVGQVGHCMRDERL